MKTRFESILSDYIDVTDDWIVDNKPSLTQILKSKIMRKIFKRNYQQKNMLMLFGKKNIERFDRTGKLFLNKIYEGSDFPVRCPIYGDKVKNL